MIRKYQGCLLGLTIGDALGSPAEFLSITEIKKKYGRDGITDFHAWRSFQPGSYTAMILKCHWPQRSGA